MKALYYTLKLFAVCLAGVLFLIFVTDSGKSYTVENPEKILLNVTVLSDCHVEGNNVSRYRAYSNILNNVKHCQTQNDAVVFLGDNTMNGQHIESFLFYGALGLSKVSDQVIPVMGNHDVGNGEGDFTELYNRFLGYAGSVQPAIQDKAYYSVQVNGYWFIVLAPETQGVHDMVITDDQFTFLDNALQQATKDGKPAFVCCHYPVYFLDSKNESRMEAILRSYSNVFYLSGHTHWYCEEGWTFSQSEGYNEINLPRCTELDGTNDDEIVPETGIGVALEVYENEVYCRVRNYYNEAWADLDYHFALQ